MENITKVHLLNVPIENDYKHTIYFTSEKGQYDYFISRKQVSFDDFSYQRKDKKIRVPAHFDTLYKCNYVMYQNTHYSDKWFYAFITKKEYIDDGRTDIFIETDVMQTWFFDYTLNRCFVEREHVNDDTVGKHTLPENLETGEYICNKLTTDENLKDYTYMLWATEDAFAPENPPLGTNVGGIWYSGCCWASDEFVNILAIVKEYNNSDDVDADAIYNLYMVPKKIVADSDPDTLKYDGQSSPVTYDISFEKQKTLNGYTPKNNKLLCFPYNYLVMSNNNGQANILHYEKFTTTSGTQFDYCYFKVKGVPVVGGSIKCIPRDYNMVAENEEEAIMCGKFPVLSWADDEFTNWLTANAVNHTVGFVTDGLKIVGGLAVAYFSSGIAAAGGLGTAASGVSGIAQRIGAINEHSFIPTSAKGNTNGGDINTAGKMNTFYFYNMSIKKEYAQIIDEYFTMFGYKCHRTKVPNKAHRSRYWYTKTVDCDISGQLDNEDMRKIKSIYDNGVTFWRNAEEIGRYDLSNNIV